jgi:hypothetical protein
MGEHETTPLSGPIRVTTALDKFAGDEAFLDGTTPAETVVLVAWYDPDGTEVRDPARIAALEAQLADRQGGE